MTTSPGASDRRATIAALGATAGSFLPLALTSATAPRLRVVLGISDADLGVAVAGSFIACALASPAAGRLADRLGWSAAVRLSSLGSAATLLAIAGFARGMPSLLLCLVLGGLAMGLGIPAGNLAVARRASGRRQGLLFGLNQAAVPAAGLLAGFSVPSLALTLGWRAGFLAATAVPLATLLFACTPARPDGDVGTTRRRPEVARATTRARSVPQLRLLAAGIGTAAVAVSCLVTFTAVAAVDAGMSESAAGMLVAAGGAIGIAVRVAAGWLSDRASHIGFTPVVWLLLAGGAGFAVFAIHSPAAMIGGAMLAYGGAWGWPGLLHHAAVAQRPDAPASATGTIQVGLTAGAAIGPLVFGLVAEHLGFQSAWLGAAVLISVAAVLVRLTGRRLPSIGRAADPASTTSTPPTPSTDQ